jgi:hypothetical protein
LDLSENKLQLEASIGQLKEDVLSKQNAISKLEERV